MQTGGTVRVWMGSLSAAALVAGCEIVVVEDCHPPTHIYGSAKIHDAGGSHELRSGWDFSEVAVVAWDDPDADMFYWVSEGVPLLAVPDYQTDIQDAGYRNLDAVDWAPEEGWSPSGTVEAIPGHTYIVWTREGHFAKFRVHDLSNGRVEFDWVFALDEGNPVLKPRMNLAGSDTQAPSGPRPHMGRVGIEKPAV